MKSAILVRIRFPFHILTRLDALAVAVRAVIRKRVSRAALVRALLHLAIPTALVPELATAIKADPIRRGREKGKPQRRAAS